jgi:hypothetical protein
MELPTMRVNPPVPQDLQRVAPGGMVGLNREETLYDRICALNVRIDAAYNEMKKAEKERDELINELKQLTGRGTQ